MTVSLWAAEPLCQFGVTSKIIMDDHAPSRSPQASHTLIAGNDPRITDMS